MFPCTCFFELPPIFLHSFQRKPTSFCQRLLFFNEFLGVSWNFRFSYFFLNSTVFLILFSRKHYWLWSYWTCLNHLHFLVPVKKIKTRSKSCYNACSCMYTRTFSRTYFVGFCGPLFCLIILWIKLNSFWIHVNIMLLFFS